MRNNLIVKRKELLEALGGLPEIEVQNKEWLYLLGEETRYSIMIEGIFVSEEELENALAGGRSETREVQDAINYFRTAKFVYGMAFMNYKEKDFSINIPLIRQINRGVLESKGDFRKGEVRITGSKLVPPPFHTIENLLKLYADWITIHRNKMDIITLAGKSHILFEIIHPFEDGNGRTGRILLNYLMISSGFPPVILKSKNKNIYYRAIEEGECIFQGERFDKMNYNHLTELMAKMPIKRMENILRESIISGFDRLIIQLLENKGKKLLSAVETAKIMGYSKDSIRTLIRRGKFIAVKRGK